MGRKHVKIKHKMAFSIWASRAGVGLILSLTAAAGCVEPHADSGATPQGMQAPAPGTPSPVATTVDAAARLNAHRAIMRRLIPGDDLVQALYFDWMHEPYHRASLAVAVKTVAVLDRELRLRQRGADVLTTREVDQALAWLDDFLARDWTPVAPGFRPDRSTLERAPLNSNSGGDALFAFADRATFTQQDPWMGDFDLLACAGFQVYPVGRHRPLQSADVDALRIHAAALGIQLLDAPLPFGAARMGEQLDLGRPLHPLTLAEMLNHSDALPDGVALVDPPRGEPWAGMIARRALLRGLTGARPIAMGCIPPASTWHNRPAGMRAAMWVAVLEGQRLGIVEGWRDPRDGTPTPYAAEVAHPAYLEAVAHTALDVLRQRDAWAPLVHPPRVALTVGPEHLADGQDNLWAPALLELVDALIKRQLPFDLLAAGQNDGPARARDYVLSVRVPSPATLRQADEPTVSFQIRGQAQTAIRLPGTGAMDALADLLAVILAREAPQDRPVNAALADPRPASKQADEPGFYVRASPAGDRLALVNLTDQPLHLLLNQSVSGGVNRWQDLQTGETGAAEVSLAPFGIRLLTLGVPAP